GGGRGGGPAGQERGPGRAATAGHAPRPRPRRPAGALDRPGSRRVADERQGVDREEAPRYVDEIGHARESQGARDEAETRGPRHHSDRKQAILAKAEGRRDRRPRSRV